MDSDATNAVVRKLWDYDKFCFNKCIQVPEKKFSVREETCLSKKKTKNSKYRDFFLENCTTKVLNALDFLNNFNEKGGLDRVTVQK